MLLSVIFIIKNTFIFNHGMEKWVSLIFENSIVNSCKIQTLDMHISTNSNNIQILYTSKLGLFIKKYLIFHHLLNEYSNSHHIRNNSIFLFYFQIAITPPLFLDKTLSVLLYSLHCILCVIVIITCKLFRAWLCKSHTYIRIKTTFEN